ncbi:MAG: glycosyltransferase [Bacteroidaceae bacterium]|nr:glycosyltransferase [Bacteroidaceae bacterium]
MNTPYLSIITVTYNAELVLGRTLESVAMQTYRGFVEHIIVDGASKDRTLELARTYKQEHPEIAVTLVSEPDKGLYDAMNKGLKLAKGEFVCFLNAGDRLHDKMTLEDIFDNAEHPEQIGVIYGDTNIVDNHGNYLRQRHLNAPEQLTWRSFQEGMLVCHQSFYARRTLCPPYDLQYRFSSDVDWCIRVMKAGEEQGLTNLNMHSVLTDYLDGGMTLKNHRASLIERFRIMVHYYGLMTTVWNHFLFLFR